MNRRPTVPSRALHLTWFGLSAFFPCAMLAYLVWGLSREIVDWNQFWADFALVVLPASTLLLAIGLLFRWRWARKRNALRTYENMLANLPPLDWS